MHTIEPYYNWRMFYIASEDVRSPFYKYQNSEVYYTHKLYNFYIHPQWDFFDAATLYLKVLFTDYDKKFIIIELFGEWNDCTHLDIKFFKRNVIEKFIDNGINKFILVGENVFNFFASDDCYYEEWFQELEGGWIFALNFRNHVIKEFKDFNLHYYINFDDEIEEIPWRTYTPLKLFQIIDNIISSQMKTISE